MYTKVQENFQNTPTEFKYKKNPDAIRLKKRHKKEKEKRVRQEIKTRKSKNNRDPTHKMTRK